MLLGLPPEALQEGPDRLMACILEEDRSSLKEALRDSAHSLAPINWEGRIKASCGDIKWINLRASVTPGVNGQISWEGVMWNITQSKQTEAALRESREQLAAFSAHLEQAKEEERERIARDIHDVLGGHLVAIRFELSFLLSRLGPRQPALKARALSIQKLVDDAIGTVSRVTRELRPGILKDFGLLAAIECQADDFFQRTGIECNVISEGEEISLPESDAIALFRAFQETLTNVVKHANASEVQIRLIHEPGHLFLSVEDNGDGFKPKDLGKPLSFGLRGLRERLLRLGGEMRIEPVLPQGTRVALSLPLKG
jgi:two-component system, NarL family, sensor histidine kinase UhpB